MLVKYKKNPEDERDKFLTKCLTEEEKGNEQSRREAIKSIQRKEKVQWRYRKIRQVLGRLKLSGITSLDVPIYDDESNIIGWESIVEGQRMHQILTERNSQHL